jgi:hypothetical protein
MSDELENELAALKARVAELERAKPPEPFKPDPDYVPPSPFRLLDRVSMPAGVMREMADAMPDAMVRDIFRDARTPQTLAPLSADVRPRLPQGPREPTPLSNPPGIAIADRLMDAQDQRDRAELIEREAKRLALAKK